MWIAKHHQQGSYEPDDGNRGQIFETNDTDIESEELHSKLEVFHILWERVFSVFGIPETMMSDLDKIFRSKEWLQLMKDIGTIQILSTAQAAMFDLYFREV